MGLKQSLEAQGRLKLTTSKKMRPQSHGYKQLDRFFQQPVSLEEDYVFQRSHPSNTLTSARERLLAEE